MQMVYALLPLVAVFLAVPQFWPQLARVRRAGTMAGVSWLRAALTSVNVRPHRTGLGPGRRLRAPGHAIGVDGVPVGAGHPSGRSAVTAAAVTVLPVLPGYGRALR